MATKPLKSIKFPGLSDTYTVPEVDATLATTGAAADAKKVGDEISDLKADLSDSNSALIDYTAPSRNIFNKHNLDIRIGVINATTGAFIFVGNTKTIVFPVMVTNQTHVTIHRTVISSRYIVGAYTEDLSIGSIAENVVNGNNNETVTIPVSNSIKYIGVYCISPSEEEGVTIDAIVKDLMVQFGSEYTGYEPYRCGLILPKSVEDTKLTDALNARIDKGNQAYSNVIALSAITTEYEHAQSFSASDTIGTLSSYTTNQRGRGTRYPTPEYPISAVKIYCYVGSSGNDKIPVTFEIRKDDFSTILATATAYAVPNVPQFIMFELSEPLETSEENLYFVAYVESGYTLIGAGQSVTFESCSANETYKNRYMISDGTWGYVNNISNYPLQIWTYKNILVPKNNKSNIIYVGMSDDCDYHTIQDAIDNANDSITNPVTIYIFNGEYDQFSMINADRNVIHYISLIGQSRDGVIVRGNKGIYEEPTAEIHTEGTIQNITFIQETSVNTKEETTTNYNYCYAVHDDYTACNTEYNNCKFVSNAGPAVGMGIKSDTMKTFRNCLFHCNGDGTFGVITMGAIFTHGEMRNNATNQGLTLENCTAINDNGANGLYIGASGDYTGTSFNGHIRNCGSFGNGVAAAYCVMPLTYSYGNNVDVLNVI